METERSAKKRALILSRAREVFSRKGFKSVTMSDIVEACGISRGGLYLYFADTKELFLAVLEEEVVQDDGDAVEHALAGDASAGDMLAYFLKEQKREILKRRGSLAVATYEFYAACRESIPETENPLRRRFDASVRIAERLIRDGVAGGEFVCADPEGCARNLLYVIEGLRSAAQTIGVTQEQVDRELMYVLKGLIPQPPTGAEDAEA